MTDKPREFWIDDSFPYEAIISEKPFGSKEEIHVIEYSAYEKQARLIERLRGALEPVSQCGNCGGCRGAARIAITLTVDSEGL